MCVSLNSRCLQPNVAELWVDSFCLTCADFYEHSLQNCNLGCAHYFVAYLHPPQLTLCQPWHLPTGLWFDLLECFFEIKISRLGPNYYCINNFMSKFIIGLGINLKSLKPSIFFTHFFSLGQGQLVSMSCSHCARQRGQLRHVSSQSQDHIDKWENKYAHSHQGTN